MEDMNMKPLSTAAFVRIGFGIVCSVAREFVRLLLRGRPDQNVSFSGTLARESVRRILTLPHMRDGGFFKAGADLSKRKMKWRAPKGYALRVFDLPNAKIELLQPEGPATGRLIYLLHGGAYTAKLTNNYRSMAVKYSSLARGADAALLEYRVAPEFTYPCALDDAVDGWDFLLGQGYRPENILVTGDSAGGNLAVALVAKLRDSGKPLPCGIIGLSPWLDLASEGESYAHNADKDPLYAQRPNAAACKSPAPLDYAGDTDLHDIYLSPVYGSFAGFPPMLLQVGGWESILSDAETAGAKAAEAGVDAKVTAYEGMFHVFQAAGGFTAEGKAAWAEIEQFIRKVLLG